MRPRPSRRRYPDMTGDAVSCSIRSRRSGAALQWQPLSSAVPRELRRAVSDTLPGSDPVSCGLADRGEGAALAGRRGFDVSLTCRHGRTSMACVNSGGVKRLFEHRAAAAPAIWAGWDEGADRLGAASNLARTDRSTGREASGRGARLQGHGIAVSWKEPGPSRTGAARHGGSVGSAVGGAQAGHGPANKSPRRVRSRLGVQAWGTAPGRHAFHQWANRPHGPGSMAQPRVKSRHGRRGAAHGLGV